MINKTLTKAALHNRALYLDISRDQIDRESPTTVRVMAFVSQLKKIGFCVDEELLHALTLVPADTFLEITWCLNKTMGVHLNWAPLVKGWRVPTGESYVDHLVTWFANVVGVKHFTYGKRLPCGHFIPDGTFPMSRYNGCPFCGKPFETSYRVYFGQASKLKELRLFTREDMQQLFSSLLTSTTPLDGTQRDTLAALIQEFPLPGNVEIKMKETLMFVIRNLMEQGRSDEAAKFFKTPTDILRYLWYEKTGLLQIVEPKTLMSHAKKLYTHMWGPLNLSTEARLQMKERLKLKYGRKTCLCVAQWINALPMSARQAAENMHPKRGMWVRMIRALRLAEYSHKPGFEHLAEILDVFYRQDYTTWQGRVDRARLEDNPDRMLALLKERPGIFARSLFSLMLWFGGDKVLAAFEEVADKFPARLLLSLVNAAEMYFDPDSTRIARPITGVTTRIKPNQWLSSYDEDEREAMVMGIVDVYKRSMARRFAAAKTEARTIYIDPALYHIPVGVGDRSSTVQELSCTPMGMRFPVEGDNVRLFLQWGEGLSARHLDMDLSCRITFSKGDVAECAYYNLTCVGAKHSGDIRYIPDQVGTAEYIELYLPRLETAGAQYVIFTCNAYSTGALSPNLKFGWMDSAYPMRISEKTGVAYDPSCVQHLVRIAKGNMAKGLVFGVLDVAKREIIWLEMPFTSQTLRGADSQQVEALIRKLEYKVTVGELLDEKARAQHLTRVDTAAEADEAYTSAWALNPAEVSKLLGD